MPFGFLGSASVLVLLGAAVPVLFALVWPKVAGRPTLFVTVAVASGVVAGVAFFLWHASPLTNIGIAGQPGAGGQGSQALEAMLKSRYAWAIVGVAGVQLLVCTALRMALGRNSGL